MTTLSDLANQYWQSKLSNENLNTQLSQLAQDGSITGSELNSLFNTVQNYTGSGRQAAGLSDLESMWFDNNGNVLVNPQTYGQEGYITGDSITTTSNRDAGWSFYDPFSNMGDNNVLQALYEAGKYQPDGIRSYNQLTDEERNKLFTQGLFPNISNIDFADNQESLTQNTFDSYMQQQIAKQQEYIRNTGQQESEGWLLNQGLGTLFNVAGSALGVPFLNLAGNIVNTGQSVENGNLGSALLSGLNVYNNAGSMSDNITGTDNYTKIDPSRYLQQALGVNDSFWGNYIGNAGVSGGVAALNGSDIGEAIRNSLVQTGLGDLGSYLGLNDSTMNLIQYGLPYLFNRGSNLQNSITGITNNTSNTNTDTNINTYNPIDTNPYSLTNPQSLSYTNPFASVPAPTYGTTSGSTVGYDTGVTDESDTENPYNTAVNYMGSTRNTYG